MGRNRKRDEEIRDARREEILRAALRRFAVDGFGATRMSDLAREAGVSQGLVYHYFPSKDEIYLELVRGGFSRLLEAIRGLEEMRAPPGEKLALALEGLLDEVSGDETFAHNILLMAEAGLSDGVPPEAREVVEESRERPYRVLAGIFAAGQGEGTVVPGHPGDQAVLFWSLIRGLALSRATRGRVFEASGGEFLTRIFLAGDGGGGGRWPGGFRRRTEGEDE